MILKIPRVHAVTDDVVMALPDLLERIASVATVDGVAIHIRADAPAMRLIEVAEVAIDAGATVIINDRIDVALITRASGVHLPERSFATAVARALVGGRILLGRSTHTPSDADSALAEGADYAFVGPIWSTDTHPNRAPLGPANLARCRRSPVVAIGGVTPDNAAECRANGAHGVAAIRAIWHATDPHAAAKAMLVSLTVKGAKSDAGGS